jgi:hypothetical protein
MSLKWQTGVLVTCCLAGCQAGSLTTSGRFAEMEPVAEYTAQMRRLFDDELGVLTTGSVLQIGTDNSTSALSNRVLAAHDVIACQVGTVTEGSAGDSTYAKIEFRGPGQSLTHAAQSECPPISVSSSSYCFSVIHQSNAALVGRTIVIFVQQFNELGRPTLHWHAEFDGPFIRNEIKRVGSSFQ